MSNKRSPLGLFKSARTKFRKRVNHENNMVRRSQLHAEKARESNPDKKDFLQKQIDLISKGTQK